jgi:hypothetical protein
LKWMELISSRCPWIIDAGCFCLVSQVRMVRSSPTEAKRSGEKKCQQTSSTLPLW